jgi:hypothetical protein
MRYFILLTIVFLFSCTKSHDKDELSMSEATWEKMNLNNYEFTLSVNCFCPATVAGPHVIKVVDDTIALVNGQPYDHSAMGLLMTIDELFTYIGKSIDRKPYQKSLTYNSQYGYPESIYFDFEKAMADEEIGYKITGFVKN